MYTLLSSSTTEYARERQLVLRAEADKYRLLQRMAQTPSFPLLRRLILMTGNLLIVGGLWLKASTQLEQSYADDQGLTANFRKTVLQ